MSGCLRDFGWCNGRNQREDAHNKELVNNWVCNDITSMTLKVTCMYYTLHSSNCGEQSTTVRYTTTCQHCILSATLNTYYFIGK